MDASLFRYVTVSPLDGRTHTWDDWCGVNNPSHVAFAKEVSDRQLDHLRSLSQQELAQVVGTEGCTPTARARTILLDERIEKPGHLLTKEEIDLAVRECYDEICSGNISPIYTNAVIEGIWDRTVEDAVTEGKGIQEGVEQLLWLTSRVVKGQACGECGEGITRNGHLVNDFTVMALEELEQTGKDMGLEWRLSDKGRFMLDKLISIFESDYGKFRHLAETRDASDRYRGYEELETMWCQEYPECHCWDENRVEYHDHGSHIPITTIGNNTSRLPPYPSPPSYLDLGSLLALAPNEKSWVQAALGSDPMKKVKTILQNPAIGRPGLLLSSHELSLGVDDVYSSFRYGGMVDESYVTNLLDALVDRVRKDGEGMTEGIERVVKLAARMVKGEACGVCHSADYQSPTHGSVDLARRFVDAIEDLDGLATDYGVEILLSSRTRYSIDKLCSIYESFDWVRHLDGYAGGGDDLEEMWCHEKSRCDANCWDPGFENLHLKWCRPSESCGSDYWDVGIYESERLVDRILYDVYE